MKVLLCLVVCAASAAAAPAEEPASELPTAYDYHRRVGIPEAERIRRAETEAAIKDPSRIVGGSLVNIQQHPHQSGCLMALSGGWTSICGGSLVSNTKIVSAAHCWTDGVTQAMSMEVVLGSTTLFYGGHRDRATHVAVHPNWQPWDIRNDIMVITFPGVAFNEQIWPIALPDGGELYDPFVGRWTFASGFGGTADDASGGITNDQSLSHVSLLTISNDECRSVYGGIIFDSTLCTSGANGVGTCGGDSGGPLVTDSNGRRILIGVTSFGAAAGCQAGLPSAFARITYFMPFIRQHM